MTGLVVALAVVLVAALVPLVAGPVVLVSALEVSASVSEWVSVWALASPLVHGLPSGNDSVQ
jgi:hypothetical protein